MSMHSQNTVSTRKKFASSNAQKNKELTLHVWRNTFSSCLATSWSAAASLMCLEHFGSQEGPQETGAAVAPKHYRPRPPSALFGVMSGYYRLWQLPAKVEPLCQTCFTTVIVCYKRDSSSGRARSLLVLPQTFFDSETMKGEAGRGDELCRQAPSLFLLFLYRASRCLRGNVKEEHYLLSERIQYIQYTMRIKAAQYCSHYTHTHTHTHQDVVLLSPWLSRF